MNLIGNLAYKKRFSRLALLGGMIALLFACSREDASTDGFNLEDYKGEWLIINYWATWCGPCLKEIPELNTLAKTHQGEISVLGVNYDKNTGEQLTQDIAMMGIEFETLEKDPAAVLKLSRPEGLPVTYLYNPEGEMAAKLVGPQTSASLLARIELLEQRDQG